MPRLKKNDKLYQKNKSKQYGPLQINTCIQTCAVQRLRRVYTTRQFWPAPSLFDESQSYKRYTEGSDQPVLVSHSWLIMSWAKFLCRCPCTKRKLSDTTWILRWDIFFDNSLQNMVYCTVAVVWKDLVRILSDFVLKRKIYTFFTYCLNVLCWDMFGIWLKI